MNSTFRLANEDTWLPCVCCCFWLTTLQVGLQRALLRDTARVLCYLIVSSIQTLRQERALASGFPLPSAYEVSPDEVEVFCRDTFASAGPNAELSAQPDSSSVSGRGRLKTISLLFRIFPKPLPS